MKSNPIAVKKASTYYLIGTVFNKGISFITVPIFTRILSVSDYGVVTTYNSWVSIVSVFASLAIYMGVRASFIDYEDKVEDFLSVITVFTLLYGGFLAGLVITAAYILPISVNIVLVVMCMVQSVADAVIENISMFFMMKYRYKVRTVIMVLPGILGTVISIIFIRFVLDKNLYLGRIVPNALVTIFLGMTMAVYALRQSPVRFNGKYLRFALRISIPLVLHAIALNILSQSDRTMITYFRSSTETGIYGLVYNFSMIAMVFTTGLDGVWVPFFTQKMKQEDYASINVYSKKYIKLMTVIISGVVLLAPEVLKFLATKEYWEGIDVIPPIVLANYFIFLYTFYVNVEHYHKKTLFISLNTVLAAIVNIVLNCFFIRIYGYTGAAYTTIVSYILSLILHSLYAHTLNKKLFPFRQMIMPIWVLSVIVLLFYAFAGIWYVRWLIAFTMAAYVVLMEKDAIIFVIKRG